MRCIGDREALQVTEIETQRPVSWSGVLIIVAIWAGLAWLIWSFVATSEYD